MADPSAAIIVIAGQTVTPFARVGQVRIDDVLNDAPNTAALTLVYTPRVGPDSSGPFAPHAFDPVAFHTAITLRPILTPPPVVPGAPIQIYVGAIDPALQIFGGQIATREQYAEFDQPQHVRVHVSCIDFLRRLNHRVALKEYGSASASAIVLDLIATFAPGISVIHVAPGLPTITGGITFTFETVSRALSRIAEKIGAYWYVDYVGDLHFFQGTEPGAEPAPIVPGADFAALKIAADLSQVRTRVTVEGDGATVIATLPAGETILPISLAAPFNPAGGRAVVSTARIQYTGLQVGGAQANTVGVGSGGTPPPTPPTAPTAAAAGPTGQLAGGPYRYAVTFETADGSRSDLGAPSNPVTLASLGAPDTTGASLPVTPAPGPVRVGATAQYAHAFVASDGRETPIGAGNVVTGRIVANPTGGPFLSPVGPGRMLAGLYYYMVTFLTPAGETLTHPPGTFASITGTTGGVDLSFIPIAPDARVVGRRVYRSSVSTGAPGNPVLPWRHVIDIPNNTDQNFSDRSADSELAPRSLPAFSSASDVGEAVDVTIRTSPDARVVGRRLYRKDGAGEFRLIADIRNNSQTYYLDLTIGPGGNLPPTGSVISNGAISVTNIPLGPAGTARRRIFRTYAGGSEFRELTAIGNNTVTTITDATADSALGGSPLPPAGGPGSAAPPAAEGAAVLQVSDLTGFPVSGWAAVEAQLLRYTGQSSTGGLFLTGIPATGDGAITAAIPAGTVITASPALSGVTPAVAITRGDPIHLIAQVDDLPAQTALAALEGGDGILEHYIQDRRLSEAGATARGRAELALFKTIETRITYTTHDPNTRSGRTVHIDLPAPTSIAGDFLIQRVTIDDVSIAKNWHPRRAVEASTTRFSFEDVLNRLLMEQA